VIGEDSGDRPPGPALTGAFRAEVRDWLAAHVPAQHAAAIAASLLDQK
jgi:hypothetical protein